MRLQQIVWNLISNAIKFTPNGGEVSVQAFQNDEHTKLEIIDNGLGIRADFLPFVFDRFRQSDGSITRSHGGLGLGLSISRHLVEMHGGTIAAFSAGERLGATFTVVLPSRMPLQSEEAPDDTNITPVSDGHPAAEKMPSLAGVTVLVVDDEPDSRRVVVRQLLRAQASVREANSAAQATEILSHWLPDVLISDIAMPEEDGYGLVKRLRASQDLALRSLPAIALTAFARIEDQSRATDAGFQKHLPKPFDPVALLNAVDSLASRQV